MFFELSKGLSPFLAPLPVACGFLLLALLLSWRRPGTGRLLVLFGLATLAALGSGGVAERLVAPLERAFPVPPQGVRAEAVVVLGGAVDLAHSTAERVELNHRVERILEGALLVKRGRARWLVLSGGSGDPHIRDRAEADLMAVVARELGVDPAAIVLQTRSRTTHEDALYTVRALDQRGIGSFFLVTTAMDMPRAMACFRKEGADPIPYPVDFRVTPPGEGWRRWVPSASALRLSGEAIHEYLGYAVYWALGYL